MTKKDVQRSIERLDYIYNEDDMITQINTLEDQVLWDMDRFDLEINHVNLYADVVENYKSFRGRFYFLSNMYLCDIEIGGMIFPSAENAYQAMKCGSLAEAEKFCYVDPYEAKSMGRKVHLRKGWNEDMKLKAMRKVLRAKFDQEPELIYKLIGTAGMELCEKGTGDTYWGKSLVTGKDGKTVMYGKNMLGKLLCELREEYIGSEIYEEYCNMKNTIVLGTRGSKSMKQRISEEKCFGYSGHGDTYSYAEIAELFDNGDDFDN